MAKKLKLFRKSGAPVDLSDRLKYTEAWQRFYDKAAERAKLDMLKLQRMLRFGERQLIKKFNIQVTVDMPRSEKAWVELVQKYEDCPIMLARTKEGSELVAIIMDEQF